MPPEDDDLTPQRREELRALREHELLHRPHQIVEGAVLYGPAQPCHHCGDPANSHHPQPCCQDCWLELTCHILPPPAILNNAPHKPKSAHITSLMREPGTSDRVDYFGDSTDGD